MDIIEITKAQRVLNKAHKQEKAKKGYVRYRLDNDTIILTKNKPKNENEHFDRLRLYQRIPKLGK